MGSAQDVQQDQVLDEILVGPVPVGLNKFVLQADPPDISKLEEVLGVTVVLITCSYKEREFCRVGYYVNNEWIPPAGTVVEGEETPTPPTPLDLSQVQRQILADKPRVTKFQIAWDDKQQPVAAPPQEMGTPNTAEMSVDSPGA